MNGIDFSVEREMTGEVSGTPVQGELAPEATVEISDGFDLDDDVPTSTGREADQTTISIPETRGEQPDERVAASSGALSVSSSVDAPITGSDAVEADPGVEEHLHVEEEIPEAPAPATGGGGGDGVEPPTDRPAGGTGENPEGDGERSAPIGEGQIRLAVWRHVNDTIRHDLRIGDHLATDQQKEALDLLLERDPRLSDIADQMGITVEEVVALGNDIVATSRQALEELGESPEPYVAISASKEIGEIMLDVETLPMPAGMTQRDVQNFLQGKMLPANEHVQAMLDAMDVPPGEAEAVMAQYDIDVAARLAPISPDASPAEVLAQRQRELGLSDEYVWGPNAPTHVRRLETGEGELDLDLAGQALTTLHVDDDNTERLMRAVIDQNDADIAARVAAAGLTGMAAELETMRLNAGMTRAEVAEAAGLSRRTADNILAGASAWNETVNTIRATLQTAIAAREEALLTKYGISIAIEPSRVNPDATLVETLTQRQQALDLSDERAWGTAARSETFREHLASGEGRLDPAIASRAFKLMGYNDRDQQVLMEQVVQQNDADITARVAAAGLTGMAAELQFMRLKAGMPRPALADAIGVTTRTVDNLLKGDIATRSETVTAARAILREAIFSQTAERVGSNVDFGRTARELAKIRDQQGWSNRALSRLSGVPAPNVDRFFNGRYPSPEDVEKIAAALSLPLPAAIRHAAYYNVENNLRRRLGDERRKTTMQQHRRAQRGDQ